MSRSRRFPLATHLVSTCGVRLQPAFDQLNGSQDKRDSDSGQSTRGEHRVRCGGSFLLGALEPCQCALKQEVVEPRLERPTDEGRRDTPEQPSNLVNPFGGDRTA